MIVILFKYKKTVKFKKTRYAWRQILKNVVPKGQIYFLVQGWKNEFYRYISGPFGNLTYNSFGPILW